MNTERLFGFEPEDETYRQRLIDLCEQYADLKIEADDAIEQMTPEIERLGSSLNLKGDVDEWNSWHHINTVLNEYANMRDEEENWEGREDGVFPALRLQLAVPNKYDADRNWLERWIAACQSVNWEGCSKVTTAALVGSPVWEALGNGAGGYEDWLGNPFPPFAFASCVNVVGISKDELHTYGLSVR